MKKNNHIMLRSVLAVLLGLLLALSASVSVLAVSADQAADEPGCVHVPAGDPEWNWSEDHASCTAVFTCAECGETFTREATVTKEWQGEGPDQNGNGRYYFIASVSENGHNYYDFTKVFETEGYKTPNPCPLDGIDHGDSFIGKLTRFFHRIIYSIKHLFEINKSN